MTAIEDARRLLAGITPGPWMDDPQRDDNQQRRILSPGRTICDEVERDEDADFIAAAPALVASLADTIEAVAALHKRAPDRSCGHDIWVCVGCSTGRPGVTLWPCPTARLVSPEATEATK
jgi:hypothetical protein